MSKFDDIFINMCKDILENGYMNESDDTRAHWEDGTPAHTIKNSCVVNRYDLSVEAPVMTLRPVPLKSCIDELLFIWQKKTNDLSKLNSHIWDAWAMPESSDEIVEIEPRRGAPADLNHLEKYVKNNELIIPLEKIKNIKMSRDGDEFYKIEDLPNNKVKIQFIKTGTIFNISKVTYNNGKIKDTFKRTKYGIGYLGHTDANDIKDILNYFGKYYKRWCCSWSDMIGRVVNRNIQIGEDFLCRETFLRWVMKNNRYGKNALKYLEVDKDYYGAKMYSSNTCILATRYDNFRLTSKKWYIYNGKTFFFDKELAEYVSKKDNHYSFRVWYSKIRNFIKQECLKGSLKIVYPQQINENGKLWRYSLDVKQTIGTAYGYQLAKKYIFPEGEFDQVDNVLYNLKHHPNSRRILTSMYNFEDLHSMALYPCAYSMTFNVKGNKLNAILNQRSQDILTANAWNVLQYACLVYMFAHVSNLEPGELVHVIADAHIYDRHIPLVKELIQRKTYPAPKLEINHHDNFYNYRPEDFKLINYEKNEQIKIEVAV